MFLNQSREVVKVFEEENIEVKFRYPTLSDEIAIEAKMNVLTRGQLTSMSLSVRSDTIGAINLAEAIATLNIVATFVKNEVYYWEGFIDDDGRKFIMKCYEFYKSWRDGFRPKLKESSGGEQEKNSNE